MEKDTLVLPSLSPVGDKPISAIIDARCTSVGGGVLRFLDVERRLNLANRLGACLHDPRQPGKITHSLDDILRFRTLAIVAGYPDGNDCDMLRDDPAFKMALDRSPVSGPALCSQPTVSRIENLPRRTDLYRMGEAMLELYCDSFPVVPHHLTLDLDESFDRGEQELRKFNAYYDDWGLLPIHIFDTSGRLVVSVLREAATPSGREILTLVKRVAGHIRERFPRVRIRLRGDSHYACPEVMSWCEANGLEYIFGLSGNATLAARVQALEARTGARYAARRATAPAGFKLRRYKDFQGGAKSWKCERRIIARVEVGPDGVDTRYIVTNLTDRRAQGLYERKYCQRGRMENLLKAHKLHLASDRTSCMRACANQFRLFLHGAAYWLLWTFQNCMPTRSPWRVVQFDTLRNRLIKLVAEVIETADRIQIALALVFRSRTSSPSSRHDLPGSLPDRPGSVPTLSNPAPQPQTYNPLAPPRPGRLSTRKTQS